MIEQTSKTVLLAEDDDDLRHSLTAILTKLRVGLIVGADGAEALQKARQHQGRIDLLISDLWMREMSGIELAQRLCSERPETKVLLMSGFGEDRPVLKDEWRFVRKPFRTPILIAMISAMLQGERTFAGSLDQPGGDRPRK